MTAIRGSAANTGVPARPFRRDPHRVLGPLALVVVVAVLTWFCLRGPLGDLWVYREGVLAAVEGRKVYGPGVGDSALPFTYPPFGILALSPLAVMPPTAAALLWFGLGIAALVDSCRSLRARGRHEGCPAGTGVAAMAAVALLSEPVLSTLSFGQINLVIMALVLRDVTGRGPLPPGVLLGLVAGVKLSPAAFILYYALYYAVTGRWQAVRNACHRRGTVLFGAVLLSGPSTAFWLAASRSDSPPAPPSSPSARNPNPRTPRSRLASGDRGPPVPRRGRDRDPNATDRARTRRRAGAAPGPGPARRPRVVAGCDPSRPTLQLRSPQRPHRPRLAASSRRPRRLRRSSCGPVLGRARGAAPPLRPRPSHRLSPAPTATGRASPTPTSCATS